MSNRTAAMTLGFRTTAFALLGFAAVSCIALAPPDGSPEPAVRPARWAAPLSAKPGLPNLHKVNNALYRGAQPEDEGFARLEALGIKTVINLRAQHSDAAQCAGFGLDYVEIPMLAWNYDDEDVIRFLTVAVDPDRQPVFVHCKHGADRTGLMIAAYRVVVEGWSKEEAIDEMTEGGYGFHAMWHNLVNYIRNLNEEEFSERVRKQTGNAAVDRQTGDQR